MGGYGVASSGSRYELVAGLVNMVMSIWFNKILGISLLTKQLLAYLCSMELDINPLSASGYFMYSLLQHTETLHSAHRVFLCLSYCHALE
jgi:hypothetical protein